MRITANHTFTGRLDLGSLERIQSSEPVEQENFRLTVLPGQVVDIPDKWYRLTNIQSAISAGHITVANYKGFVQGDGVTKITVSATPPLNPAIGDLWVDIS